MYNAWAVMSNHPRYRGITEILQTLRVTHRRRKYISTLTRLAALITAASLACIVAAATTGYWADQPPAAIRWPVAFVTFGLLAAMTLAMLTRLLWRQNPAQIARFVESQSPELANRLTNSILLATDANQPNPKLIQRTIDEAVSSLNNFTPTSVTPARGMIRWTTIAAVAIGACLCFALMQPKPFVRGIRAVFMPWRWVSHVNDSIAIKITPEDTELFAGSMLRISVSPGDVSTSLQQLRDMNPQVVILAQGQDNSIAMLEDGPANTLDCLIGPITEPTQYRIVMGDNRWPTDKPWYTVGLLRRVEVLGLDISYTYPKYTAIAPTSAADTDGNITAPIGSTAVITLRLTRPIASADLATAGEPLVRMAVSGGNTTFTSPLNVDRDGKYRLTLRDATGRAIGTLPDLTDPDYQPAGGYYTIRAVLDSAPKIAFMLPARDTTIAPGKALRMRLRATDDYPLGKIAIMLGRTGTKPSQVFSPPLKGNLDKVFDFDYTVPDKTPDDGSVTLEYFATVTDTRRVGRLRLNPQYAKSRLFRIAVRDDAKLSTESATQYELLRKKLLGVLRLQLSQRVNTAICWTKHAEVKDVRTTAAGIAKAQDVIHAAIKWLVKKHKVTPDMLAIRSELAQLQANEAPTATEQAQTLASLASMQQRNPSCAALSATQGRIIFSLQSMLAIMPELSRAKATKDDGRATDIPPGVQDTIDKLKSKLAEFADAQRKAITVSKALAKLPADVFEDSKAKLDELKVVQDKWEKFIDEQLSDMSKLAQQDFSNPQLLSELLSVKCDVTMAKDALSKKAIEIATAAEENSLKNATTLTANIEKWLPDKPDREKWAMEALEEQDNVEMPELPSQLEDLVGDLLEQEEDLFEEMDDVTSKAAGSFDKGAGWDAMDGPISSMNAQGVTGNQLPNSSEIQGRSGEGRQGKSTGEFVEDKAVGKGGRRTPTRLTPEAFMKGQVKDTSQEPQGGATGGGKLSGAGSEGLEGAAPPQLRKELKRLAGKQAQLMNRAERIRGKMHKTDPANLKLFKAVTLMNRVRSDLEQFRYHNALRMRKELVGNLKSSTLMLSGEIDVQADETSAMPKYIRDDISDAMNAKLPAEFKDVLKQYYQRLSETPAEGK